MDRPSLVPSSAERTLEIDLHWTPLGGDRDSLTDPPAERWPRPRDRGCSTVSSSPFLSAGGTWRTPRPRATATTAPTEEEELPDHRLAAGTTQGSGSQLQPASRAQEPFPDRPLREADPAAVHAVRTRSRASVTRRILRRYRYYDLYLPGGKQAERQLVPSAKTRVLVDFTVDLGAIRYQDDRVVRTRTMQTMRTEAGSTSSTESFPTTA